MVLRQAMTKKWGAVWLEVSKKIMALWVNNRPLVSWAGPCYLLVWFGSSSGVFTGSTRLLTHTSVVYFEEKAFSLGVKWFWPKTTAPPRGSKIFPERFLYGLFKVSSWMFIRVLEHFDSDPHPFGIFAVFLVGHCLTY